MTRHFTLMDCEQRSPEWHAARAGLLTASRAADMLATIKTGEAAARRDYRLQLVTERLTGHPQEDGFVNAAMQRGIDVEPLARMAYEAATGELVQQCGFLRHDALMTGCSIDGYLGDFETILTIKCPKSSTHLGYLQAGRFPVQYEPQMLHELWITGASRYEFLSFDDRFPQRMRCFRVSVERSSLEPAIADYALKAAAFLKEVDEQAAALARLAS